jgi:cell wall-associated NlpC family hydrolase
MKRFITFAIASLVMASCATSATAIEQRVTSASALGMQVAPAVKLTRESILDVIFLSGNSKVKTLLEQQVDAAILEMQLQEAYERQLLSNTNNLGVALDNVRNQVGKTWYVFSGSTPSGWDCSGLVMWTYSHLGIELEHSATAQMRSGELVTNPKPGDLVAFLYKGRDSAYHVGLYERPDTMLHSGGKPGDKTELRSISKFAGDYSDVVYIRIVKTN